MVRQHVVWRYKAAWRGHESRTVRLAMAPGVPYSRHNEPSGTHICEIDHLDCLLGLTHIAHMKRIGIRELHLKTGVWVRSAAFGEGM